MFILIIRENVPDQPRIVDIKRKKITQTQKQNLQAAKKIRNPTFSVNKGFEGLENAVFIVYILLNELHMTKTLEPTHMNESRNIFDIAGVAEYTTLSSTTIYKKVCLNEIPYHKIGTRTLFMKDEIDDWIRNDGQMYGKLPELKIV